MNEAQRIDMIKAALELALDAQYYGEALTQSQYRRAPVKTRLGCLRSSARKFLQASHGKRPSKELVATYMENFG